MRHAFAVVVVALTASSALVALAPESNSKRAFDEYLNGIAHADLVRRDATILAIQTRTEAERRKAQVRATVLRLIGGLPDKAGPLKARRVGTLHEEGFHVERVIYDSLPDFPVTADLYLPDEGKGRYPAILYTPGHYAAEKLEAWLFAANMARNGVAVLAYDPIGEGERLQYFDAATNRSMAGPPTGEHSEASLQTMLKGDAIARYFVWDAMRGIDYLRSRGDIDASRIGALGCSGGGTVTAYLAALDTRVKAAGVACYITGFDELLNSIGPQEAEQSIPGFLQEGLSFPDWIETVAPMPYAVISTTEDMFPFAGAERSVEEARRIYGLYGADDRLQWIIGPGRHANLRPIYPQIMSFFLQWLKGSTETPVVEALAPPPAEDLLCTKTGQVANALGGATVSSLNRARAPAVRVKVALTTPAQVRRFRDRMVAEVRATLGLERADYSAAEVRVISEEKKTGYTVQTIGFSSVTGTDLPALLTIPEGAGAKPAILMLGPEAPREAQVDRLAGAGNIVFALQLPPGEDSAAPKSSLLGPFYIDSLRAFLVGKSLVGIRVEDVLRAVDWPSARPDVDGARVSGRGVGPMGIVLLHAAALDPRIGGVTLERTLVSYRDAVEAPVTRGLAQSVIPGVPRHYDLDDLTMAVSPRAVTVRDPIDGAGSSVDAGEFDREYGWVLASDRNLRQAGRVRVVVAPVGGSN